MITSLAPLGATHNIQIVLSYEGGNASATVLLSLKSKDKEFTGIKPIVFEGTVAEVETAIADTLPAMATSIVKHTTTLAELEQAQADELAAKKAKAAAVPAPAPAKRTPAQKAKDEKTAAAVKAKAKTSLSSVATPKPAEHAEPVAPATPPGLTRPSWKKEPLPPEPVAEPVTSSTPEPEADLGSLFPE